MFVPFFVHWYANGPVPDATVLKETGVPGQLIKEVRAAADVLARTVSVAQLVTLVQKPVTWMQYVPASLAWTEAIE